MSSESSEPRIELNAMEGTEATKTPSMVNQDKSRKDRMLRYIARLSFGFGIALILVLVAVRAVIHHFRPLDVAEGTRKARMISRGIKLGGFMILAPVVFCTYRLCRRRNKFEEVNERNANEDCNNTETGPL